MVLTLIAASAYPWFGLSILICLFVGRILYSLGYVKGGPRGRIIGSLMMMLANLVAIAMAIASIVFWF